MHSIGWCLEKNKKKTKLLFLCQQPRDYPVTYDRAVQFPGKHPRYGIDPTRRDKDTPLWGSLAHSEQLLLAGGKHIQCYIWMRHVRGLGATQPACQW